MNDASFDAPTPPTEAWWERELHRNEKLMDRYMKVFEDEGEGAFEKYDTPDKLYNKVHYGVEPGEPLPPDVIAQEAERDPAFEEWKEEVLNASAEAAEAAEDDLDEIAAPEEPSVEAEADPDDEDDDDEEDEADGDGEDECESEEEEAAYRLIAQQAREFAVKVLRLSERPEIEEVLMLSAGKIGANLAGGHGLGYGEETLCGNIVKCRWALADCEFCREILEHIARRTGDAALAGLVLECRQLAEAIRERIANLRGRVWW